MIPESYEEWKNCVTVSCGINLTREFLQKRIAVFENRTNNETQKFISIYGEKHYLQILSWFKQAAVWP
jgi:dihydroorotase